MPQPEVALRVIHSRCAGGDVDKMRVVVCLRIQEAQKVRRETRTFPATTTGLLDLGDWLEENGCSHFLIESTGVYWRPVYHLLSERVQVILANAAEVKNVPGRKSDVSDAAWLADLLAHGLVRPSFIPPPEIQELRDLTRTRRQFVREIARHKLRLQKTLEDANVKIAHVVSDLLGESGRRILKALIDGEIDAGRLADLGNSRLQSTRAERIEALRGRVTHHHRFMLKLHLDQVESLEATVATLDARIEHATEPFRALTDRLVVVPGLSLIAVWCVLAEIGVDMNRFPTAAHLISWAGLCPRLATSAGKRLSTRIRPGNPWLKAVLIQAAWAATRKRHSYFQAQYRRLRSRRGPQKALIAVAASLLTAIYHIIREGTQYRDLGADHFDRIASKERLIKHHLNRLRKLGYPLPADPAA
jgi:transposase